jgi:hypothetical protein
MFHHYLFLTHHYFLVRELLSPPLNQNNRPLRLNHHLKMHYYHHL